MKSLIFAILILTGCSAVTPIREYTLYLND